MCTGRKQPRFRGHFGGTAWPIRGTAGLNARTSTTGQGCAEINDGFASRPCTKVCWREEIFLVRLLILLELLGAYVE